MKMPFFNTFACFLRATLTRQTKQKLHALGSVSRRGAARTAFTLLGLVSSLSSLPAQGQEPEAGVKTEGLGIISLGSWSGPGQINRDDNPHLKGVSLVRRWHELEPADDDYRFQEEFGVLIEQANQEDFYVKLLIYVGDESPEWLFDIVPTVYTDHPNLNRFPYYLNEVYTSEFFEMIDAFGAFLGDLPPPLQDRIHFVFAVEGVTADGAPYKGNLLEDSAQYAISDEEWAVYRQETWEHYRDALPVGMPIIVNSDANTDAQNQWLVDNMHVVGLKYGMFSHGYHVSDAIQRLAKFRAIEQATYAAGKQLITEGEEDAEIRTLPRGTKNIVQALYWGGLYATHNPIYLWTVPREFLKNPENNAEFGDLSASWEILEFFNRYASKQRPELSPRAFVALRDGLNAADTDRFPEGEYPQAVRNNIARYQSIADEFAWRGAVLQDPPNARLGPFQNRRRAGYNDVGWNILPGNYSRFIEQIQPGTGDVGWWHVDVVKKGLAYEDASHYSRFARGFDVLGGKNAMYFDVQDDLASGIAVNRDVVHVQVIYFDEVAGSTWQLRYDNGAAGAAVDVVNTGSGQWKTLSSTLTDAVFENGLSNGADIALVNTDFSDDIFHRIDIEYEVSQNSAGSFVYSEDIGDVGRVGSTSSSSGTYEVSGSGEGIGQRADAFHYVYNLQLGDGEIFARIESLKNVCDRPSLPFLDFKMLLLERFFGNSLRQQFDRFFQYFLNFNQPQPHAGVMIRESYQADAKNVAVLVDPNGKVVMQWRDSTGGTTEREMASSYRGMPIWVRLARDGDVFTGYVSEDGSSWSRVAAANVTMKNTVGTGLAVSSHKYNSLSQAIFSEVTGE